MVCGVGDDAKHSQCLGDNKEPWQEAVFVPLRVLSFQNIIDPRTGMLG